MSLVLIVEKLPEPRHRALIACQIQTGSGMTWTNRTYEVIRASDGQWRVDFGAGPLEPRRDWAAVLSWLASLRPRDVELLEDPAAAAVVVTLNVDPQGAS